ncbi:MAG: hypothetical protein AB1798_07860 [Spirochaetota bacterium]
MLLFSASLFADEDQLALPKPTYGLGDQMFSLNAGLFVPLFFNSSPAGIKPTNLKPGGVGSLEWDAFINDRISLGVEVGGMFALSPLNRTLVMVPITFKFSYFLRSFPFEFPLFLGVGINFTKLQDDLYIGPILKPGASFYWAFNAQWSFGLNLVYWWVPQWYIKDELKAQTRYGNFLAITLSALYHF